MIKHLEASLLAALKAGDKTTAELCVELFTRAGRSTVAAKLASMEQRGLIGRRGAGKLTRWHLGPGGKKPVGSATRQKAAEVERVSPWLDKPREGFTRTMGREFLARRGETA